MRINQILNNLINNAIKFTEQGCVSVETTWTEPPEGPGRVRISVRDSGIGIAPDKRDAVFESFSQEKGDTARQYGGTGLGLTIVKQLVELMNGDITVESEEGVGSIFTLTLDMQRGDESLVSSGEASTGSLPLQHLEGVRILLAEDNRNNQILAKKFLTDVGCGLIWRLTDRRPYKRCSKVLTMWY